MPNVQKKSKYVFTVGQRNDLAEQTVLQELHCTWVCRQTLVALACGLEEINLHIISDRFSILLVAQSVFLESPPHNFLEIQYTWIHLMHIHGEPGHKLTKNLTQLLLFGEA